MQMLLFRALQSGQVSVVDLFAATAASDGEAGLLGGPADKGQKLVVPEHADKPLPEQLDHFPPPGDRRKSRAFLPEMRANCLIFSRRFAHASQSRTLTYKSRTFP